MEFSELVKKRYSVRAYKPDPVEDDKLQQVLEAACLAPTAANRQPFQLIVIQTAGREAELQRIYNRDWFVQPAAGHLRLRGPGSGLGPPTRWQELHRSGCGHRHGSPDPSCRRPGAGHLLDCRLRPHSGARGAAPARRRGTDRLHTAGVPGGPTWAEKAQSVVGTGALRTLVNCPTSTWGGQIVWTSTRFSPAQPGGYPD